MPTQPAGFEESPESCWLVSKCFWSGLCVDQCSQCWHLGKESIESQLECGFGVGGARDVFSAPFPKVKSSLGAPD